MEPEPWVTGASGLRGPRDLVELAECELESQLCAAEEGYPIADRADPLLAALVIAGLAHRLRVARLAVNRNLTPTHVKW